MAHKRKVYPKSAKPEPLPRGKVIGIVGSRRRNKPGDEVKLVDAFTKAYVPGDRIVSGGCPDGADNFAEAIAREWGISITIHYPRKETLPKGFRLRHDYTKIFYARNQLIAEDCDILIAVVAKDRTGGTEDTIKRAKKLGKKVILVK